MEFEKTAYEKIIKLMELSQKINDEMITKKDKSDLGLEGSNESSYLTSLVTEYNTLADGIELPKDANEFILYTIDLVRYFKDELKKSDCIMQEGERKIKIYENMIREIES